MVLFILTTSFFQSERVRICTSHSAATIGGTALLVSKAVAHLVRPRCLVYCLPIPAPLVLSRRRPHADGSGVCAQPNFTGPPERSRFYGLRLMVNEVRNERKGVEVHPSLYTLYFRMAHLFRPPKRVKSICFGRIRLRFILSFSVVPAEIVQADVIVVCDLLQLS